MITFVDCGLTDTLLTLILTDEHLPEAENSPMALRKVQLINPVKGPALKGEFLLDGTRYHFTKIDDGTKATWSIEGPALLSCGASELKQTDKGGIRDVSRN